MDSSDSPTFGQQEGSTWNGHFRCTCYHPLFVFNQFGDLERCAFGPGNVHSAEGWRELLEPVIAAIASAAAPSTSAANAAFVKPEIYERWRARAFTTRSGYRPIASCRPKKITGVRNLT